MEKEGECDRVKFEEEEGGEGVGWRESEGFYFQYRGGNLRIEGYEEAKYLTGK